MKGTGTRNWLSQGLNVPPFIINSNKHKLKTVLAFPVKNKQKKPNPFLNNEIEKMTPHFLSFC